MTATHPIACPGCDTMVDGENVYSERAGYRCRLCSLSFKAKQIRPDSFFYLITMHWVTGEWRVEQGYPFRNLLDKHAEDINANQRHNARKARVISRGELGEERTRRPRTLAEAFGIEAN